MTVSIYCKSMDMDEWFNYGNTFWITILNEFVKASLLFLQNYKDTITGDGDEYKGDITAEIEKILHDFTNEEKKNLYDFNNDERQNLHHFIELISSNDGFINTLIDIGIGGIYSLLYKDPYGGKYSVGSSVDILEAIENISPYIKDKDVVNALPDLLRVFRYSVDNTEIVIKS